MPQCFDKDGNFCLEKLQELLKKDVLADENYELNFLGKSYVRLLQAMETDTVITPDEEHNSLPQNADSENLYITGDNLDALKHLLKSYENKIKCIYIDPPYNTGSDGFVYNDRFSFTKETLMQKLSVNEEKAERILELTTRGSASHSAWLTFMYPRLLLARDLLTDDGVIFISIDDNEQANLKLLCDDVFGEQNFIGEIIWKNATDNNPTQIAIEHEYIICFAKDKNKVKAVWKAKESDVKKLLIEIGENLIKQFQDEDTLQTAYNDWYKKNKRFLWPLDRYKYIDKGGIYTGSQSVHNPGREGYRYDIIHPKTGKPCCQPLFGYRFPEATMKELIDNGKILFGDDESKIVELKVYAKDYEEKLSSVFELDGRLGAYDVKSLFNEKSIFNNPKPVQLLKKMLSFILNESSIILDFFSGSATTAHAVMQLNTEDGGNRKFILVQLPEATKADSEARRAGYETIDQIGRERIKRAAAKIKEEHPDTTADLGFKHFRLNQLNSTQLSQIETFSPELNLVGSDDLLQNFGTQTVLATWLNRDGMGLTRL